MRSVVACLAVTTMALAAVVCGRLGAAERAAAEGPAGTTAAPTPQAKGKPAPKSTRRKRTKVTIPPGKAKKG